jgi:hypothetical protein
MNISAIGENTTLPLISFYSIIDEDISVLKYVILKYNKYKYFDISKISSINFYQLLGEVYNRDFINPLYIIKNDNIANCENTLDNIYDELINDKEADILNHSTHTEIYRLIIEFKKSSNIVPSILYYTKAQKDLLESIKEFKGISLVNINELSTKINNFSQFYFKTVDELMRVIERYKLIDRTFYVSTFRLNLNEDKSDINMDNDIIMDLIKNKNRITLYDIYRMNIIGGY